MKINLQYWANRLRIALILTVFGVLYHFGYDMWGWILVLFFLFSDIADTQQTLDEMGEDRDKWKNILMRPRDF